MDARRALGLASRSSGQQQYCSRHGANDRLDHRPRASPRSGRKRGIQKNALGRSRGGFSTKIHLRTNAQGLPIGSVLTPGGTHDVKGYGALMHEDAPDPKVLLADRGYDADDIRSDTELRGGTPVIPTKKNRRVQIQIDGAICGRQTAGCTQTNWSMEDRSHQTVRRCQRIRGLASQMGC